MHARPLAIFIGFALLGLVGCATQDAQEYKPVPVDMKAIESTENQIKALLHEIHELEEVRHSFARYYEKEDGTSEWAAVLSKVPHYDETESFRFDQYTKSRKQLCESLKKHVTLLRLQLQYLKDTLSHDR